MRVRVVLLTAAAALVVLYLLQTMNGGPDVADGPQEPARVPRTPRGASETTVAVPPSLRNVFEYLEAAPRPDLPVVARAVTMATLPAVRPPEPSPSPLIRLVGLVHRGAQTRAALAVGGDTVVLAAGEQSAGYTVVSIDEDEGVRVKTPDGGTIVLSAGREQ